MVFISITSDEKIRSPSYDSRGGEESLQEGVFFIRLFVELLCPNKTYQILCFEGLQEVSDSRGSNDTGKVCCGMWKRLHVCHFFGFLLGLGQIAA